MDVIASTAFGIQVDSHKNPDNPLLDYARELMGTKRTSKLQKIKATLRIMAFCKWQSIVTCMYAELN